MSKEFWPRTDKVSMRNPFLNMVLASGCSTLVVVSFLACSGDKDGAIKGAAKDKDDEEVSDPTDLEDLDSSSSEGDSQSLEEILKDCGVDQETLDNPDAVLLDKTLTGWPKVFVGQASVPLVSTPINYRVNVKTKLKIHATMKEMTQTIDFDVTTEPSGGMIGDTIKTKAGEKTEPNRGSTTAKVLETDKRPDLMSSSPDWNGVLCTVQPVTEVKTVKAGMGKLIRYDPPLPMSVSPKANGARYEAEIGQGKTWNNITAEILSSGDPALPVGTKLTGSVSITPTDPNLTLQINQNGGTKTFSASRAFTLRFDFGGVEKTLGLGLNPMQTMYIDEKTHDVKVVVVDTGVQETGVVVLSEGGGLE
jgi:hypothetical protein